MKPPLRDCGTLASSVRLTCGNAGLIPVRGDHCRTLRKYAMQQRKAPRTSSTRRLSVEVAGIEPASDGVAPGLLRVQSAGRFSRPQRSRRQVADGPSHLRIADGPSDPDRMQWLSG